MSANITPERRLTSARLRPMLQALLKGQAPEAGLSDLVRTLGDGDDVEKGFFEFIEDVRSGRSVHMHIAELYIDGYVDVVGFRNGEPLWAPTGTIPPGYA